MAKLKEFKPSLADQQRVAEIIAEGLSKNKVIVIKCPGGQIQGTLELHKKIS